MSSRLIRPNSYKIQGGKFDKRKIMICDNESLSRKKSPVTDQGNDDTGISQIKALIQ